MTGVVMIYSKDRKSIVIGADSQSSICSLKHDIVQEATYSHNKIHKLGEGVFYGSGCTMTIKTVRALLNAEYWRTPNFTTQQIDRLSKEELTSNIQISIEAVMKTMGRLRTELPKHFKSDDPTSLLCFITERWDIWIDINKDLTFRIRLDETCEVINNIKRKYNQKANAYSSCTGSGATALRAKLNELYLRYSAGYMITDQERIRRALQSASSKDNGTGGSFVYKTVKFDKPAFEKNNFTLKEVVDYIESRNSKGKIYDIKLKIILKTIGENQHRLFRYFTKILTGIKDLWNSNVSSNISISHLVTNVLIPADARTLSLNTS